MRKFEENPTLFDLILTDQTMPFLTGDKLVTCAMEIRPDIPVIICSGFNNVLDQQDADNSVVRYLNKPVSYLELAIAVQSMLVQ